MESSAWLVVPLLFGVFVIVPPQSYYEVTEALGPFGWGEFYQRYVTASGNWCDSDGCLITPTYNHLWFVAYLFIYTVLIVPVGPRFSVQQLQLIEKDAGGATRTTHVSPVMFVPLRRPP